MSYMGRLEGIEPQHPVLETGALPVGATALRTGSADFEPTSEPALYPRRSGYAKEKRTV